MANKLVEIKQLFATWNENSYQSLEVLVKSLKNNKRREVPEIDDILSLIKMVCKGVLDIYPILHDLLPLEFKYSQEDLNKKFTCQDNSKKSIKVFLLSKALKAVIPSDVGIQKYFFKMERYDVLILKIQTKYNIDIRQLKTKIASLEKMEENLTAKNATFEKTIEQLKIKITSLEKIKEESDNAKKTKDAESEKINKQMEAKYNEIKKADDERKERVKKQNAEIDKLKKTQADMEKIIQQKKAEVDKLIKEKKEDKDDEVNVMSIIDSVVETVVAKSTIKQLKKDYAKLVKEKEVVENESHSIKNVMKKKLEEVNKLIKEKEEEKDNTIKKKDNKIISLEKTKKEHEDELLKRDDVIKYMTDKIDALEKVIALGKEDVTNNTKITKTVKVAYKAKQDSHRHLNEINEILKDEVVKANEKSRMKDKLISTQKVTVIEMDKIIKELSAEIENESSKMEEVNKQLLKSVVKDIISEVINKVLEHTIKAKGNEIKQLENTVKEKDDLVREANANVVEMNNQIEDLNNKNKELNTSISNKDIDINALNLLIDAENQKEEKYLHLAKKLNDRENEVIELKRTIKIEKIKSKDHERIRQNLMIKCEELRMDKIKDREKIIQSYRQTFEQKDKEMKNMYSPRLEKPTGFMMAIHEASIEEAVKKPIGSTRVSQYKRKRKNNAYPLPNKTKKQKRDNESDNKLAII